MIEHSVLFIVKSYNIMSCYLVHFGVFSPCLVHISVQLQQSSLGSGPISIFSAVLIHMFAVCQGSDGSDHTYNCTYTNRVITQEFILIKPNLPSVITLLISHTHREREEMRFREKLMVTYRFIVQRKNTHTSSHSICLTWEKLTHADPDYLSFPFPLRLQEPFMILIGCNSMNTGVTSFECSDFNSIKPIQQLRNWKRKAEFNHTHAKSNTAFCVC